ncbi:MAG: aspartate aminotransferase family protein [Nitrospirota bacterium]
MESNLSKLMRERAAEQYALYERYVNAQMAKVLKTIGFDRTYVRAEGCLLYDQEGRDYLDMLSGWGVFNIGRNHPAATKAIADLLSANTASLVQMDAPLLAGLLAEALVKHAPAGLDSVHFTNSGAETTEAALKFARYATKRSRILSCRNGYHGLTYGALSVIGSEYFRDGFGPFLPGCQTVPFNDIAALERELAAGDVAAFITEPIQGGGVIIPDDGYLAGAKRLCARYGALLIIDEIQTGLGRTGKLFACEHWGVTPDLLLIAKSLSAGLVPVGAVLMRQEIFRKVFHRMDRCVINSATFAENNLAMAAGLTTLRILDEERLVERSADMGALLLRKLEALKAESELIREVRGRGLMIAIEFGEPRSMGLRMGWKMIHGARPGLFAQMIVMPLYSEHRILTEIAGANVEVIKLIPPLPISEAQVDRFVGALASVLKEAQRFPGGLWDTGMKLAKQAISS